MDYCLSESNNNYVHAKFVCPFFQHGRSAVTLLWRTFWLSPVEQRETRYWLDKYSRATATLSITYCCESWALVPHRKQLHKTSASRDRPSLTRVTACSYRSQYSWVHIWWVHCYWSLPLSEDDRALCGGCGDPWPLKSHEILQMTAKQSALKLRAYRYYIFTRFQLHLTSTCAKANSVITCFVWRLAWIEQTRLENYVHLRWMRWRQLFVCGSAQRR